MLFSKHFYSQSHLRQTLVTLLEECIGRPSRLLSYPFEQGWSQNLYCSFLVGELDIGQKNLFECPSD